MREVGSARVQSSRMVKGLEQSRVRAGIFSKISNTIFEGRFRIGFSWGRWGGVVVWEVGILPIVWKPVVG